MALTLTKLYNQLSVRDVKDLCSEHNDSLLIENGKVVAVVKYEE